MAGLQSQNISVASTRLPGPSTADKDVCVFCHRRATPPASDPHAPLFPFFSLVDCRHYACQPCALVHCDNAGRRILCPQCNCVSRLAQSGRRRTRSSAAATATEAGDADRVLIDDGVSSVRSHRSATLTATPHRSALKGQSGTSKKRSSSVQFPANPTTSIVDADHGSKGREAGSGSSGATGAGEGEEEGKRETSPLTQDAVAALPVDPAEARRQRVREQQQRRAAAAAAQAEKSVSLYAITAAPPQPVTASMAGDAAAAPGHSRRSKERSRSQPTPKLPNTILEPRQVFPLPPPLVLHTVEEDEAAATGGAVTVSPMQGQDASSTAAESVTTVSKVSAATRDDDGAVATDAKTAAAPPSPSLSPVHRAQLEDCEAAEADERATVGVVEGNERRRLRQRMEEAEIAIHARRGLEVEFDSTPVPPRPEVTLDDVSDQVSATSDDEMSQRSSVRKGSGASSSSRRKQQHQHRTPRQGVCAGGEDEGTVGEGKPGPLLQPHTPANAPGTEKAVTAATASAVDTPSPMTAVRAARPADDAEQGVADKHEGASAAPTHPLPLPLDTESVQQALAEAETAARAAVAAQEEQEARACWRREQLERAAEEERQLFAAQLARLVDLEARAREHLVHDAAVERDVLADQQCRAAELHRRAGEQRAQTAEEERLLCERQLQRLQQREERAREQLTADAAAEAEALGAQQRRLQEQQQRLQRQRELSAEEERRLFATQRDRLVALEQRAREQIVRDAEDDRELLMEQQAREGRTTRRASQLRDEAAEAAEATSQRQQREQVAQQLERDGFARQALVEREALERGAVAQTEAAVRALYAHNLAEWRTSLLPLQLQAEAAALAAHQRQCRQEVTAAEAHGRAAVVDEEADEWSWIVSGARVDRVVAATEESERVQREYDELRHERQQQQFHRDVAALLEEEQRGRAAFVAYERTTRDVLQSHHGTQRSVTDAEAERQQREAARRNAARRAAVQEQRWQREREEVDADEAEGRAVLREEEREERRTASMAWVQGMAAARRRAVLTHLSDRPTRGEATVEDPSGYSDVPTVAASESRQRHRDDTLSARDDSAAAATASALEASRVSAAQLEEMYARQSRYEEDLQAALQRLEEAERRVAEEAAVRARAEMERAASQAESDRLLREAEQRAEQRIHDARDAAERLLQAQLADVRDEAARRAEHAALMQRLAEEEQRAVLEAKLQAAERQLQQAEQRAQEEMRRAREESAAMAAAEAARVAREAQRRQEEWEEHARAEARVRAAEQESERAEALRRLGEVEANAAEALAQAREEVARNAAAMEERMAEMERRQQAREAELALAMQKVRSARDSMRDFDSHSQSSQQTSPSNAAMGLLTSSHHRHPPHHTQQQQGLATLHVPPHAMASSVSTPSAAAGPVVGSAATPPRVQLSAGAVVTPVTSAPAAPAAAAAAAISQPAGYPFDPAQIVRAAIREAVMEIVAAQQRALTLQDQAEQHLERSERRLQRRRSDQQQAAQDVADMASPSSSQRQRQSPSAASRSPVVGRGDGARSDRTPSLSSEQHQHRRYASTPRALEESPWSQASASATPVTHHGRGRGGAPPVPVPSASAAEQNSAVSAGVSNTSSIYFDDYTNWMANDARRAHNAAALRHGQRLFEFTRSMAGVAAQEPPHSAASVPPAQPHHPASRTLFPSSKPPPLNVAATAQEAATHTHEAGHAYNEPDPRIPPAVTMEYSPPPRRSTTRAAGDGDQPGRAATAAAAEAGAAAAATKGKAALPEPSQYCMRCYRDDTTSPCWRCGEIVCRRCGLQPDSARKLCCTAHLRAQLREHARRKALESGAAYQHAAGGVKAGGRQPTDAAPSQASAPLRHDRDAQQRVAPSQPRRGHQQVQTSFQTSTSPSDAHDVADGQDYDYVDEDEGVYVDEPQRHNAGTSPWLEEEPESMIPPAAYYRPSAMPNALPRRHVQPPQQQQQAYYFDRPSAYPNPVSVAAMTAGDPYSYHPVMQPMPYGYAPSYPAPPHFAPPPPQQQQQQQQWVWPSPPMQEGAHSAPAAPQPTQGVATQPPLPEQPHAQQPTPQQQQQQQGELSAPPSLPQVPPPLPPPPATHTPSAVAPSSAACDAEVPPGVVVEDDANSESSRPPQDLPSGAVDGAATATEGTTPERKTEHAAAPHGATPSTPNGADSPLEEPKTERKPAAAAFFVALEEGAEEPRRPKPPTPCNYVPSKLFPSDGVRAATTAATFATAGKARAASRSPPGRPLPRGTAPAPASARKLSPPVVRRPAAARAALHDPYATRAAAAPQQRRPSPSPYGVSHQPAQRQRTPQGRTTSPTAQQQQQPLMAAYMKLAAPMPPQFFEVRKDGHPAYVTRPAASPSASKQQQQQRRRSHSSESSSSSYTSTSASAHERAHRHGQQSAARKHAPPPQQQQQQQRSERGRAAPHEYLPATHPDGGSSRMYDPYSRSGVDTTGYLPQRPQLQPSHHHRGYVETSNPSHSSFSTGTTRTQPGEDYAAAAQHRYAPYASDTSAPSFSYSNRRVPTLAELDQRLQQLRAQDEFEAAQHQQRQAQLWHNASPSYEAPSQPRVHVLLNPPRSAVYSGGAGSRQTMRSPQREHLQGRSPYRHHSRSPKQRTVSPPWRTDLNASPLRPRWDISQPRSNVYHPTTTAATTAGQ